ncbi:hypothetical protein HGRIS_000492 [Hohenbuehelia grisea]|uniref:Karyogamy protein 5 n=1 Tax=Hohenbuehelia grisea TaxID=104357 RepID=A0ABR3JRD2_9AGAR
MSEEQRVRAAISMTLCELATAKHHAPPLECLAFSVEAPRFTDVDRSESQGVCVDALSRSAQFWSSYSGYLREIPQLCYAYRRWNDIDTAKNLYRNATIGSHEFLRLLLLREEKLHAALSGFEIPIKDIIGLRYDMAELASKMERSSKQSVSVVQDAIRELNDALVSGMVDFQVREAEAYSHSMILVDTVVQRLNTQLSITLSGSLSSLSRTLEDRLTTEFERASLRSHEMEMMTNDLYSRWTSLGEGFSAVHQAVSLLSNTADSTLRTLENTTAQLQHLDSHHREAERAVAAITQSLVQLADVSQIEMAKINASAEAVRHGLQQQSELYHWKEALLWIARVILQMDPLSFEYFSHLRLLRPALSILAYVVKTAAFSVMSALLFVVSSHRLSSPHQAVLPHHDRICASCSRSLRDVQDPQQPSSVTNHDVSNGFHPPSSILALGRRFNGDPRLSESSAYSYSEDPPRFRRFARPRIYRIPDRFCDSG